MLVILRSVVFNVLFYLNLSVQFVAALPTLVMPRRAIIEVAALLGAQQSLAAADGVRHAGGVSRAGTNSPKGRSWSHPSTSRCGKPSR